MKAIRTRIITAVILILLAVNIYLLFALLNANREIKFMQFKKTIYDKVTNEEFNELLKPVLREKGIYAPPAIILFGEQRGVMKAFIQNNFNYSAEFSVQVIPESAPENYLIELPVRGGPFALKQNELMTITFGISLNYPVENEKPKFFIQVKADNAPYAESSFVLLHYPDKAPEIIS